MSGEIAEQMNYIDTIAHRIFEVAHGGGVPSGGPTGDAPLYRMYAVLALAKGEAATDKDVHDAWSAWMAGIHPDHRSLIPFDDLKPEIQHADTLYRQAIHTVAAEL